MDGDPFGDRMTLSQEFPKSIGNQIFTPGFIAVAKLR